MFSEGRGAPGWVSVRRRDGALAGRRCRMRDGKCVSAVLVLAFATGQAYSWSEYKSRDGTAIPDVDKNFADPDNSCWLAAASNLLGAGGWGKSVAGNAQTKADHIYGTFPEQWKSYGGNTSQAMKWWIKEHGRKRGDPDYDPDNTYSCHYNKRGDITQSKYGAYIVGTQGLGAGKYLAVSFYVPGQVATHIMTIVGGDDGTAGWHDSDSDEAGGGDTSIRKNIWSGAEKKWYLDWDQDDHADWKAKAYTCLYSTTTARAIRSSSFDNFSVVHYNEMWWDDVALDMEWTPRLITDGACVGGYTGPDCETEAYWDGCFRLVVPNQPPPPNDVKEIWLSIDYATFGNCGDPGIYIEDSLGAMCFPNVEDLRWDEEGTHLLLRWVLDDPGGCDWETVVFPDAGYHDLYDPETEIGTVHSWELAAAPIPEFVTLTVNSGNGDGIYQPEELVEIEADPAESGMIFDAWVGDTAGIEDVNGWTAMMRVPASDAEITATYVEAYTLTVNSGVGGGIYKAGEVIEIEADPPPSGMVFYEWEGDCEGIEDVYSDSTRVTMATSDAEITAGYRVDLPGDLDGSGFVGQGDLDIVLDQWGNGQPSPPNEPISDSRADPSGDEFVGQADLDIVLDNWGEGTLP